MKRFPFLNVSVNGLFHLWTRRGMKQGFEERQIARAKVIFSARLLSLAGFFFFRFLIHKTNPLQSAESKLPSACELNRNARRKSVGALPTSTRVAHSIFAGTSEINRKRTVVK